VGFVTIWFVISVGVGDRFTRVDGLVLADAVALEGGVGKCRIKFSG